jgi:uncharacterized protein (TIGR03083 family)
VSSDVATLLAALRDSHDRLFAFVPSLAPEDLRRTSYDDGWTVAQVLSHLGSGSQLMSEALQAALDGSATPGPERMSEVWSSWDSKSPEEQAADAGVADEAFLVAFEELDDEKLQRLRINFEGSELNVAQALFTRLNEHALHAWDVFVTFEPSVRVRPEAVDLMVDILPSAVPNAASEGTSLGTVAVETKEPHRRFVLDAGADEVRLVAETRERAEARLSLPAEALVRLVFGRLDAAHTPLDVSADGVELETLRRLFPGI